MQREDAVRDLAWALFASERLANPSQRASLIGLQAPSCERTFGRLVEAARRRWRERGCPAWPLMLADWQVDHLVDRVDGRRPPRPPRT